jgi:hypothetical protein
VVLYDLRNGKSRAVDAGPGPLDNLALSADGRLLAWASNRGQAGILDTDTLEVVRRLPLPQATGEEANEPYPLLFAPDGKRLAIGLGSKGTMVVQTTSTGTIRTLKPAGTQAVRALHFRGMRLLAVERAQVATASGWATDLSVRDVESSQTIRPAWRTKEVLSAIFRPDGSEMATTHESGEVVLWEVPR